MIQLSQAAASEIERLKSKQKQPLPLFRLAVKPGGCSGGWYYDMSFDEAGIGDRVFNEHGIQVVVDRASLDYINGLVLDYSEDLMGGVFASTTPKRSQVVAVETLFHFNVDTTDRDHHQT